METCDQSVLPQNFVAIIKFKIQRLSLVLRRSQSIWKMPASKSWSIQKLIITFRLPSIRVFLFKALCFGHSTALQVFMRMFSLVLEWDCKRGIHLLHYLDNWLVIAELNPFLLGLCELLLCLCQDLKIVINWEKSGLGQTHMAQYLGMLIGTLRLSDSYSCYLHLWRCGSRFLGTWPLWSTLYPEVGPGCSLSVALVCLSIWSSNANPIYRGVPP